MTPDEKYLEQVLKDGAAVVRTISMKDLASPDVSLQARVKHLDEDHVVRLLESLRDIGNLRSIVVFRDVKPGQLWLADGFHRHEAYHRAGRESIPAILCEGGRREALRFATMCNRENCLARTKEDQKKAAYMLFADAEWEQMSCSVIAEHIGASMKTVEMWRATYAAEEGKELPEFVRDRRGRLMPRTTDIGRKSIGSRRKDGNFAKVINGRRVILGRTPAEAQEKLSNIDTSKYYLSNKLKTYTSKSVLRKIEYDMNRAGIACSRPGNVISGGLGKCLVFADSIVICEEINDCDSALRAIARAVLNREKHRPDASVFVVCHDPFDCEAMKIAKRLGIEFVTHEHLITMKTEEMANA